MQQITFSALTRLKAGTNDLHRSLDRSSGMTQLLSPELELGQYYEILRKLHGIYRYVEPKLLSAQMQFGEAKDWELKTDWLMSDLHSLRPDDNILSPLPKPSFELHITSAAAFAGCLYVLEGSTLGGQIICKRLLKTLGAKSSDALRFFSGYGEKTYSKWAATSEYIQGCILNSDDIFEACLSAREVFQMFITHMETDEKILKCA